MFYAICLKIYIRHDQKKKINYIPHKLNENPVVQHVIIRMWF